MKTHIPQNQLYIDNHILMRAGYPTPEKHRHTALHLMIADPEQGELRCEVEGVPLPARAIMIASGVEHTAMMSGEPVVMLYDVTSELARSMERQYLQGKSYCVLPEETADALRRICRQNGADLAAMDAAILDVLHLRNGKNVPMDPRVVAVIADLHAGMNRAEEHDGHADTDLSTETMQDPYAHACEIACLSQDRFSHLFKENVGISFRSYLLMMKMRKAYECYLNGQSVTEISMSAGFDSASHYAGTIHRMFGLSFTDFARNM